MTLFAKGRSYTVRRLWAINTYFLAEIDKWLLYINPRVLNKGREAQARI